MAQFARPISDLDNRGVWTTAPLWSDIDDAIPTGDASVVLSDSNPAPAEPFTVDLGTITDPTLSTGHIIRGRWAKVLTTGADYILTAELREGYVSEASQGALRATLTSPAIAGNTLQTDAYTLSGAEADAITDYSDLQFRCFALKSGGGANRQVQIADVEFETPDAGGSIFNRNPQDDLDLTDEALPVVDYSRPATDPLGLTDDAGQALDAARSPTDPLGLTDAALIELGKNISDNLGLTDSLTVVKQITANISDNLGLTDALLSALEAARSPTDPLGLTDALNVVLDSVRGILDGLGLTDSLELTLGKTIVDPLGLVDSLELTLGKPVADALGLTDSLEFLLTMARPTTDALGLTDSLTAQLIAGGGWWTPAPIASTPAPIAYTPRTQTDT